jgi:hypothetical protein
LKGLFVTQKSKVEKVETEEAPSVRTLLLDSNGNAPKKDDGLKPKSTSPTEKKGSPKTKESPKQNSKKIIMNPTKKTSN